MVANLAPSGSFASNAAHELRSPLAGAIAQAQRWQSETTEPTARQKARKIEATLKRLTRLVEKLMQLFRAEGARLWQEGLSDLRLEIRIVAADLERSERGCRVMLTLPTEPVMSDMDPDAVGILTRNLIENALRHGDDLEPVTVALTKGGSLRVSNAGSVVPPEKLDCLTERFQRSSDSPNGSGLGFAIVAAISDRIGGQLALSSPRSGAQSSFEARIHLPVATAGTTIGHLNEK